MPGVTNSGSCYKVCQVLQILAVVTKRDVIDVNILTDVFVFEEQFKMAGWGFFAAVLYLFLKNRATPLHVLISSIKINFPSCNKRN